MKSLSWALLCLAPFLLPGTALTQENDAPAKAESATGDDWLEFYYVNPDPSRVVAEVKSWAAQGLLEEERVVPVLIGFLSQVLRQNRDQIGPWYEQLSGLSNKQKMPIHTAMAFSRTAEADTVMRERIGEKYDEQKASFPKITEMKLPQPTTLDTLMGFFYATGSETAIRRIIWSFRFENAPENPDFAKVPEGYRPLYKELPGEAAWRLESLLIKHPKVLEICERLHANKEELTAEERRWLGTLLEDAKAGKKPKSRKSPDTPEAAEASKKKEP